MSRLVANLVDNALAYGAPPVEVTTQRAGRKAVIDVADRGPGIAPGDVERLKQPFTRATDARARGDGAAGAGLGLAIVDRIARLHGGRFDLLPRDGGGTVARVPLPLARDRSARPAASAARARPPRPRFATAADSPARTQQCHGRGGDALLAAGEAEALGRRRLHRDVLDGAAEVGGDVRAHRATCGASFGACAMTVASTLPIS